MQNVDPFHLVCLPKIDFLLLYVQCSWNFSTEFFFGMTQHKVVKFLFFAFTFLVHVQSWILGKTKSLYRCRNMLLWSRNIFSSGNRSRRTIGCAHILLWSTNFIDLLRTGQNKGVWFGWAFAICYNLWKRCSAITIQVTRHIWCAYVCVWREYVLWANKFLCHCPNNAYYVKQTDSSITANPFARCCTMSLPV